MSSLLPLRRAVVELFNDCDGTSDADVRKAIRSAHNRLQTGGLPRELFCKIGRNLYINVDAFWQWIESQRTDGNGRRGPGRPRSA